MKRKSRSRRCLLAARCLREKADVPCLLPFPCPDRYRDRDQARRGGVGMDRGQARGNADLFPPRRFGVLAEGDQVFAACLTAGDDWAFCSRPTSQPCG